MECRFWVFGVEIIDGFYAAHPKRKNPKEPHAIGAQKPP